ncbi:MAG: hypothetical protein ACOY4C_14240, partial [Pseudomonadota bacterium]
MTESRDSPIIAPSTGRRRLLIAVATGLAILLLAGFGLAHWAADRAGAQTAVEAQQNARAHASLLESELQKFRLLPR